MNKYLIIVPKHKVILLILLLALLLRFGGMYPGYNPFHPDESFIYGNAVEMSISDNLKPDRFDYPAFLADISYVSYRLVFIPFNSAIYYFRHIPDIINKSLHFRMSYDQYDAFIRHDIVGERFINALYWSRYVTALFGVGVVWLTFLLARGLFSEKIGLTAALLTAVNYREVLNSHLALPDIYNAFFLLLATMVFGRLWKRPTTKNFLLAGLAMGLAFSTKYQGFAAFPFLTVELFRLFQLKSWPERLKEAINWRVWAAVGLSVLVFVVLNPYLLIEFPAAKAQLGYLAMRYKTGKDFLDFYPISYLYHIGVGSVTSLLVLAGVPVGLVRFFKSSLILLSVIIPFFFVTVYYTGAGLYTRNFVTITPFLLIFAGVAVWLLFKIVPKWPVKPLVVAVFLGLLVWENLSEDAVLIKNYLAPWDFTIVKGWLADKIPSGSVVAAHSSVPVPDADKRLDYDYKELFSMDEFREAGASYAVANLDWIDNGFYWWMSEPTDISLRYWNKPNNILENTYPAMTARELEDSAVFTAVKPWMAPDENFIVAKIPQYSYTTKRLFKTYTFQDNPQGWAVAGDLWYHDQNLKWTKGSLAIENAGINSPVLRWQSPVIGVSGWKGFVVDFDMKIVSKKSEVKDGIIAAEFYRSAGDIDDPGKRLSVRLSSRDTVPDLWISKELTGVMPPGTRVMILKFLAYTTGGASNVSLGKVSLYSSDTTVSYNGVKIAPTHLSEDDFLPFSTGNL